MSKIKSKDDKIKSLKRKVAELQAKLHKITDAPLLKDVVLPEGFENRTFEECINEVSSMGNAKSIKTLELSEVDMKHFKGSDVMDKFIAVQSTHRENNRSNEDIEKMSDRTISKASSSRATEIKNTLRVFFGFCHRTLERADFRHLLDERVVAAFPRWYKQMGRQPSSTANHLKTLAAFLRFLSGRQEFFNYTSRISSVIETIKPLQAIYSKLANTAKYMLTDEKMRLLGTWLTEPEFLMLNKFVCDFLVEKFKEDEDFVREKSDATSLARSDVALIMDHVYLLGLMYLGGQRNQFVGSLSIKNVVFEGSLTKYLKTHEKVNRQKVDYFKFPLAFSVMIRVWMTRYLPLVRHVGVEACWVSGTGLALSHDKMSQRVAPVVAIYFPGRHITPIYFRRAIVTFVKGKSFATDASGIDSFFKEKLAVLMNTSPDIIDMHYDRMHRAEVNADTLKKVNDSVGLAPTDALAKLIRDLAEDYEVRAEDYRKDAVEVVSHAFKSANNPDFVVKFRDGETKELNWTEMSPLLHLVDVYWAKVGGPRNKVPKLSLPQKWDTKPRQNRKRESLDEPSPRVVATTEPESEEEEDGEVDDEFGLDPIPDLVSSEEEEASVDLMELVDVSLPKKAPSSAGPSARDIADSVVADGLSPVVRAKPSPVSGWQSLSSSPSKGSPSPVSKGVSILQAFSKADAVSSIFRMTLPETKKRKDRPLSSEAEERPKKKIKARF